MPLSPMPAVPLLDDSLAACKVLLIDDEPLNFILLREVLKEQGLHLSHAEDGQKGIEAALAQQPTLIFLDVIMPGMDGFETCRRLKAEPATADIPVIFITALNDMKSKLTGFDSGGVDYICKPFQREEVVKRLSLHLRLRLTQQRLAEEVAESNRLESELQKFYRAFEQAPLPIFITDMNTRIEFANNAFLDFTGYQRFEVLGNTPNIIHSGLNPPALYEEMWGALQAGKTWQGQLINRKKDGCLCWEMVNIAPLCDQHGEVVNYMSIKQDISTYKTYEDQLRTCEEKLNFYRAQDLFAYIEWDPEFLLSAWNEGAARIFGYRAEEVLGRCGFSLLFPVEQKQAITQTWARVNQGKTNVPNGAFENITKSGTRIHCIWHNTVLRDHNDAVTAISSLVLLKQ
jgi:PAS domain S-box-containing protein